MIEPMDRSHRVQTVRITCDACGTNEVVACDYLRGSSSHKWLPNEGHANRKITRQGWAIIGGRHHCPACRKGRRAEADQKQALADLDSEEKHLGLDQEIPEMTIPASTVTPLREPTREQKRQIMSLLEVSYDTEMGRYKGTDTDATVAAAIGGGVMPGWVADLREEFFGPDGGNGEMEALAEVMRGWLAAQVQKRDDTKRSDWRSRGHAPPRRGDPQGRGAEGRGRMTTSVDLDFAHRDRLIEIIEAQRFALEDMTGHPEASEVLPGEHLTQIESRVFAALSAQRGKLVTNEGLFAAAYFDRPDCDWPSLKIVDVWVCKLRKKVAVPIRTVIGRGYVIDKPADPLGHLTDWQERADEEGCGAVVLALRGDVPA